MLEEWERPPEIPPLSYPLDPGTEPAEVERHRKLCEQIREHYKRRCEEASRHWPQQQIDLLKKRIEFLISCQKTPGPERYRLLRDGKCVYLMWSPKYQAFRIGHTKRLWGRIGEHQRNLDPKLEHRVAYYTLVPRRLLESFLHRHFHRHRVHEDVSEELFHLPHDDAEELFNNAAETIERHLLAIDLLRLNARLSELEGECRESQ